MKAEILQMLKDHLQRELDDVITYNELYKALLDANEQDMASCIEHIANDEYHHACAIEEMLVDEHNVYPEKWKTVEEIFTS